MRFSFKIFEKFDWNLFLAALILTTIGLIAIYSIDITQNATNFFSFYKHIAAAILGICILFGLTYLDCRQLRSYSLIIYIFGALLLIIVLFLGANIRNTQGWFQIKGLSFQPVEISKITLIFYLSAIYLKNYNNSITWKALITGACATIFYIVLILFQPDFGSAMVIFGIWVFITLFAGLPRRAWPTLLISFLIIIPVIWMFLLQPYQKDRIQSFINPSADPHGSSYNAVQAQIAIGSGGLLGKGLGEGSQARLRFLPEASTDFMFAVIGEELGLIGVSTILALFFFILNKFLDICKHARDDFSSLLIIGLGSMLFIHIFVNIGMNLGIIPITGIPIPFLSSASSYLIVTFIAIGLVESVATRRLSKI